jgi:hypothetical protein
MWYLSDEIREVHPDGFIYTWVKSSHALRTSFTKQNRGTYYRIFSSGKAEGRIEATEYIWNAPILHDDVTEEQISYDVYDSEYSDNNSVSTEEEREYERQMCRESQFNDEIL